MQVKEKVPLVQAVLAGSAVSCPRGGLLGRIRRTYAENRWLRAAVFAAIAAVCAAFFYALNLQTAMIADDFTYCFVFGEPGRRVESLGDLFISMRSHYNTMNGRLVLHFLTQLFLLWGKPVFNVVNTIGYLLFTGLLYWHCKGTGAHNPVLYAGVHLLVCFFMPVYGQTMLWLDGSANYMWGSILRLAMLLPLRLYMQRGVSRSGSWGWLALSIPAGVIAGWTNENAAAALLVMLVLFLIYGRFFGLKTPRWAVGALGGAVAGFLVMLSAPGNRVRVENNYGDLKLTLQALWDGFTVCNRRLFYYVLPVLALFAGCLILLHFFGVEEKRARRRRVLIAVIYLAGAVAGVYAMLAVPYFPGRAMFGSVACALIAVGTVCAGIRFDKKLPQAACGMLLAGCVLCAAGMYAGTYARDRQAYRAIQVREAYILQEKAAGNYDLILPAVRVQGDAYSPYYGLADIEPNPQHWANTAKAQYYGLNSITLDA